MTKNTNNKYQYLFSAEFVFYSHWVSKLLINVAKHNLCFRDWLSWKKKEKFLCLYIILCVTGEFSPCSEQWGRKHSLWVFCNWTWPHSELDWIGFCGSWNSAFAALRASYSSGREQQAFFFSETRPTQYPWVAREPSILEKKKKRKRQQKSVHPWRFTEGRHQEKQFFFSCAEGRGYLVSSLNPALHCPVE